VIARLLPAVLVLMPVAASAQQPAAQQPAAPAPVTAAAQNPTLASTFLEGSWGLRVDGSIIMRFDLELTPDGWTGAWVKPTSFASDGQRFGNIKMPATERHADSGRAIGEWAEITFDDPRPDEEDDQFRFRLLASNRAEMLYVGTGLPPFTLERVAPGALLGPFEEGKVYGGGQRMVRAGEAPVPAAVAASPPAQTTPPVQRTAPPPRQPPPPTDAPVQGPPAVIGR